jgi:hypothetical protein
MQGIEFGLGRLVKMKGYLREADVHKHLLPFHFLLSMEHVDQLFFFVHGGRW